TLRTRSPLVSRDRRCGRAAGQSLVERFQQLLLTERYATVRRRADDNQLTRGIEQELRRSSGDSEPFFDESINALRFRFDPGRARGIRPGTNLGRRPAFAQADDGQAAARESRLGGFEMRKFAETRSAAGVPE